MVHSDFVLDSGLLTLVIPEGPRFSVVRVDRFECALLLPIFIPDDIDTTAGITLCLESDQLIAVKVYRFPSEI